MLQRMCLVVCLIALAFMGLAGAAFAHLPYPTPNPQAGCILPVTDPWNLAPPYGPVDGSGLIAPNAQVNTCGHK